MRLEDFTEFGDKEEFRANLTLLGERLMSVGKTLFGRAGLGIGCRVYPAIAESTASQLNLLGRLVEEPIEVTASVCRMVFEINVALRYSLSSPQRLDDYATQAATDEISIYKSIKDLANDNTDPKYVQALDAHIGQISSKLQKHGRPRKPDRPSLFQMAKEVGLQDEYQVFYGIYSKYVHASAWFVLRKREHIDLPMFRWTMQLHAQLYAADSLKRLEDLRDAPEQATPTDR